MIPENLRCVFRRFQAMILWTAGAFSCELPPGTHFDALFVQGLRQQKARFPNGGESASNGWLGLVMLPRL